jgi:hypothetical protein
MDYGKLTIGIANAPIGGARMTDVADGVYNLKIEGEDVFFQAPKKPRLKVTENALAALRVVTDAALAASLKTTKDFRESNVGMNLQNAITTEQVKELNANTQFTVCHRVQIVDSITGTPIYKNEHYNGYPEYLKEARAAAKLEGTARTDAFTLASEKLRATTVKAGTPAEAKNILHMPVFIVSQA